MVCENQAGKRVAPARVLASTATRQPTWAAGCDPGDMPRAAGLPRDGSEMAREEGTRRTLPGRRSTLGAHTIGSSEVRGGKRKCRASHTHRTVPEGPPADHKATASGTGQRGWLEGVPGRARLPPWLGGDDPLDPALPAKAGAVRPGDDRARVRLARGQRRVRDLGAQSLPTTRRRHRPTVPVGASIPESPRARRSRTCSPSAPDRRSTIPTAKEAAP